MAINAVILRARELRLRGSAGDELTKNAYDRTMAWLVKWDPKSVKAAIATTREEAESLLRSELCRDVPPWVLGLGVSRKHLEFRYAVTQVEDGLFWPWTGTGSSTWHLLVEDFK